MMRLGEKDVEWISLELGEEKHFQNNGLYQKIN